MKTQQRKQSNWSGRTTDLEGSWRDEGDVIMAQGERLERWQGAEGPLRQEPEPVLFQVDGGGLAGKLLGQISQAGSVTQHAATPLWCAGAGWRTGPRTGPTGHDPLRQQPQRRHWKQDQSQSVGKQDHI